MAASPGRNLLDRLINPRFALPAQISVAVLFAYAVLLRAGRWQGDDYLGAWLTARDGFQGVMDRVTSRSPRPVAETLAWLYFTVSNGFDAPLIGPLLAALWASALFCIVAAGWAGRVRRPVALALVLFALTLLANKPSEMFYWPVGAIAYIPCWVGLAAATVLHRADPGRRGLALGLALSLATFSAEVGALTVVIYAGLVTLGFLHDHPLRRLAPLVLPALGAIAVCLIVLHGRMQPMGEVFDPGSGLAGNWVASFAAALPTFARETIGIEGMPLLAGAAIKLLLLLCLPPGQGQSPTSARHGVLWALALLLGAFTSVVLAYHQFGTLCCERHATLRQAMLLLALTSLAGLFGGAWLMPRPLLLAALLLVLLAVRAGPLAADWRAMPDVIATRQRNWSSGNGGGDAMTLLVVPSGRITNADSLPEGQYRRTTDQPFGNTAWFAWGIMARFGKHALVIAPTPR